MVRRKKNRVGEMYTNLLGNTATVIEYINCSKVKVRFDDSKNTEVWFPFGVLSSGKFKNPNNPCVYGIGYLGVGDFKPSLSGRPTEQYVKWSSMLSRCYSAKKQEVQGSYKGCTVHSDWHNFQNFAKWCSLQRGFGLGYELDKDLLVEGNRVYSEQGCSLIPKQLNSLLINSKSGMGNGVLGYSYDARRKRYVSHLSVNNKKTHLGSFATENEAREAYVKAKQAHLENTLEIFKDTLDVRVYKKLKKTEIEDIAYKLVECNKEEK